jgi:predicted HTH transcriptional regulator
VYASLVEYLEGHGRIRTLPFDASACRNAALATFPAGTCAGLRQAQQRQYPLGNSTPVVDVLAHLNLLDRNHPTNAAVLLFATTPQRFLVSSEIKCLHFHGLEIRNRSCRTRFTEAPALSWWIKRSIS